MGTGSLRVRVVKLKEWHGVGAEFRYAIQLSTDDLVWWTVSRFKKDDEALGYAKDLSNFISKNLIAKEDHVLWKSVI